MIDSLVQLFALAQDRLFEWVVEPSLHAMGLMAYLEPAFDATEVLLLGLIEVVLLVLLFRPLEALVPVEQWPTRAGTRVDVLYTLLHRLGFVPLVLFLLLFPISTELDGWLRMQGFMPFNLEDLFPRLLDHPLLTFFAYLAVIDFAGYWLHRLQHRLEPLWALHGVHHSQRTMSYWSDDREHFLNDLLAGVWFTGLNLVIGVPPGQYVVLLMVTRLMQSLAHANVRVHFGWLGERLLVSPHYHRVHHGIGVGSEGGPLSCNFAVLFPIWDLLFGTANFSASTPPTGIADQIDGRDYGRGLLSQQWLGLKRMARALRGERA